MSCLCAMCVFEFRASSSSPRLPMWKKFRFCHGLAASIAELAHGEKLHNQSINHPAYLMPREPKLLLRNMVCWLIFRPLFTFFTHKKTTNRERRNYTVEIRSAAEGAGCAIQLVSTVVNAPAVTGAGMTLQWSEETVVITLRNESSWTCSVGSGIANIKVWQKSHRFNQHCVSKKFPPLNSL